jgi:hypothetical protein
MWSLLVAKRTWRDNRKSVADDPSRYFDSPYCRIAIGLFDHLIGTTVLMMPVSLPAGAAGVILAEQDHGLVAGGRFVWIADTNWIDRFDRARQRGCRAHGCRWMRGPQSAMYSATGRRRSLLLFCSNASVAILKVFEALVITSLASISCITIGIAAAPDGPTNDGVQICETFCSRKHA